MYIYFVYLAVQEILSGMEGVKLSMQCLRDLTCEEGLTSSCRLKEGQAAVTVYVCACIPKLFPLSLDDCFMICLIFTVWC